VPEAARSTSWGSARFADDFEGSDKESVVNVILQTTSETFHASFLQFALTAVNLGFDFPYEMLSKCDGRAKYRSSYPGSPQASKKRSVLLAKVLFILCETGRLSA
jgi:hypothetical protein